MMSESQRAKQFHAIGNDPQAWRMSADELFATARVLKRQREAVSRDENRPGDLVPDESRVGAVEKMLQGFAVECLLKALWIKQGYRLADEGRFVRVSGVKDQHDLRQLAKVVGLTTDGEQNGLLDRLSVFTKTVGRYPIPTSQHNKSGAWWTSPTDDQMLDDLVTELRNKVNA